MPRVTNRLVRQILPVAVALFVLGALSATLHAQQSTLQLPRLSQFRTTGSFFVPDSGAAFSAGVSRSGVAARQAGVAPLPGLGQRTSSGSFSRSGVSTQVQVFSLREMEAALLESAPGAPKKSGLDTRKSVSPSVPAQALEFNRRLRYSHQPPNTRRGG